MNCGWRKFERERLEVMALKCESETGYLAFLFLVGLYLLHRPVRLCQGQASEPHIQQLNEDSSTLVHYYSISQRQLFAIFSAKAKNR
jgi:hypothetical protein